MYAAVKYVDNCPPLSVTISNVLALEDVSKLGLGRPLDRFRKKSAAADIKAVFEQALNDAFGAAFGNRENEYDSRGQAKPFRIKKSTPSIQADIFSVSQCLNISDPPDAILTRRINQLGSRDRDQTDSNLAARTHINIALTILKPFK